MAGVAARAQYNRLDRWEPPHVRPKSNTKRVSDINEKELLNQLSSTGKKNIESSSNRNGHRIDVTA